MPSSSRKKRHVNRQQRVEEFNSEYTKQSFAPPIHQSPVQTTAMSPHPYHTPTPPPYNRFGNRATSEASQLSDMTMDDFPTSQESVLEYSDTSDENRGDSYFLNQASNMAGGNRGRGGAFDSGESAFRNLRKSGSKSSRIVRFSSSSEAMPDYPFDDEDDYGADRSTGKPSPARLEFPNSNARSKQQQQHQPEQTQQPKIKSWVRNLAYSFRSPKQTTRKESTSKHRHQQSSSIMEFPHSTMVPWRDQNMFSSSSVSTLRSGGSSAFETSPLIPDGRSKGAVVYGAENSSVGHPLLDGNGNGGNGHMGNGTDGSVSTVPKLNPLKSRSTAATIAAFWLMDYEAGRPPTLPSNLELITPVQLKLYRVHFSWVWRHVGTTLATFVLFLAHTQSGLTTAAMHTYAILFFFMDIYMKEELYGPVSQNSVHSDRHLVRPLILFLVVLGLESWSWFFSTLERDQANPTMTSAIFKPLVFFYVSQKARHALEALVRIGRIVTRVLIIEMFLILTFAAVACRMFRGYDGFENLSSAWVSLFELSTTVVNPSLWMPIYEVSRSNAFFFIFFIIVSVFYLHSLVLSVVFQTYIQAATDIHDRSAKDREDAIRLAFLALVKDDQSEVVSTASVRKTLQVVRPHYSLPKIKALMEIVDPSAQHVIDYPTFRTKIRQALNASIRTARSTSSFAMGVELIAVLVAVVNFAYVILLTSNFEADWFDSITVSLGSAITLLGLLELVIRFNPLRIPNFTPITRLNGAFDGLALVGAVISCIGIVQYVAGYESQPDYLLMGRAIDMIRIMRFFQIFRDVVRRSADVLPAMAGPLILVVSVIHVYVYLGMSLWGGAIDVDILQDNENITPLYYLNNFNSYTEGLVTMFNVLVVNDWHAIAEVFLYADKCSSPYFVYPFFISGICFGVFIMLNVITAFFVESFVTKLGDRENTSESRSSPKENDNVSIRTSENSNVKRISSSLGLQQLSEPAEQEPTLEADDDSAASSNSTEIFAFDVYEREGFDQIMRTVAGVSDEDEEAFARSICDYLEVFESLSAGREKVGYMVCCQRTMNRFGNRRFQNNARDYVANDNALHKLVSDMHSELLVLTSRRNFDNRCLVRKFSHKTDWKLKLEISASLIRHQPAVSLLVSRIRTSAEAESR